MSEMESITTPKYVKEIAHLRYVPSNYVYNSASTGKDPDKFNPIPTIDFSLLNTHQRSKAIHDISKACQDWGFFVVVNHGISESLMKAVIEVANEFFNLGEEDKREFAGKHVLDPIRCGTSFSSKDTVSCWRDYVKIIVHPHFHSPSKPHAFRDILWEYCENIRRVARELLASISQSLGLEEGALENEVNLKSGLQVFTGNYYPPCPQPEVAIGLPPHSDHAFLTLLIQNQVGGLQVYKQDQWFNVNAPPNSILVNTGDQLEVLSNGKYKSNLHRAVVNNKEARISIATTNGPPLDTIVSPLIKTEEAHYSPMKYRDYLELQQSNQLDGKFCLDRLKIIPTTN